MNEVTVGGLFDGCGLRAMSVVDLFAGVGWDEAARQLGMDPLGIELDKDACATREARGMRTLRADVSVLDPMAFAPVVGLIASPPCPTFSGAGNGAGRLLLEVLACCMRDLAAGLDRRSVWAGHAEVVLSPVAWERERKKAAKAKRPPSRERAEKQAKRDAAMSLLTVEPLRWALALDPEWIAFEQVPDVLPLWKVTGAILGKLGYGVWTGKLQAERYGVPQTRERAILMASRVRKVVPPVPTHQRYVPGIPAGELTLDGIRPWVSMADALGWSGTVRTGDNSMKHSRDARDMVPYERPVSAPAHHDENESGSQQRDAVRVTVQEAAILQGFPPDFPWQGSRTSKFRQIGNAVPPPLAKAILEALVGRIAKSSLDSWSGDT